LFSDPFTELERESRKRELEAEQERNDKEKLFKEKISTIEKGLTNKAQEVTLN
jgi:hypothetical protein